MLGGAMRQAGIVAAAGLFALEHHRSRLRHDHEMADVLADALRSVPGVEVSAVHTNMVFANFANYAHDAAGRLRSAGVLSAHQRLEPGGDDRPGARYPLTNGSCRMVTHLDLPADTPERVRAALADQAIVT